MNAAPQGSAGSGSHVNPEDLPPCHGLADIFNAVVADEVVPSLLAFCGRCHLTRQCAQIALRGEKPPTSTITGIWGGVYVDPPNPRRGDVRDRRRRALAQLQVTAGQYSTVRA